MELSLALNDTQVTSSLWSYRTATHTVIFLVVKYIEKDILKVRLPSGSDAASLTLGPRCGHSGPDLH